MYINHAINTSNITYQIKIKRQKTLFIDFGGVCVVTIIEQLDKDKHQYIS